MRASVEVSHQPSSVRDYGYVLRGPVCRSTRLCLGALFPFRGFLPLTLLCVVSLGPGGDRSVVVVVVSGPVYSGTHSVQTPFLTPTVGSSVKPVARRTPPPPL